MRRGVDGDTPRADFAALLPFSSRWGCATAARVAEGREAPVECAFVRCPKVQNWERAGVAGSPRQLRDLEELWTIVKDSIKASDIPAWLRSESDAFAGRRPIELLKEGKAPDIIVEFRRLQAGEPARGWEAPRASSSRS